MPPETTTALSADYEQFIEGKTHLGGEYGFTPTFVPDFLFDFQKVLVEWAVRRGRCALLEDCGLGKTPQQLVWSQNVVQHTNGRVLIATPLAVSYQTVEEAEKFGIEVHHSRTGKFPAAAKIVVTNYEKLHLFDPGAFVGKVGDESGGIKDFESQRKQEVTDFMLKLPFRLLCSATAAPNDFIELGTHSEALGEMGYRDMLSRFFKNDTQGVHPNSVWGSNGWRFRGHAERDFWRWVVSWARAIRKPSDLGFDDSRFALPELITRQHLVYARFARPGRLFDSPAETLEEQREERKRTLPERCAKAAELLNATDEPGIAWCHLNAEGDLLTKLIRGAVQVTGTEADEAKEEKFAAFCRGEIKKLVTKPSIGAWGLNFQHCAHMTCFPSHSFEQYYQFVRRCWRYGQTRPVVVDVVTSEGESQVLANLERKARQADLLFSRLVAEMNNELAIARPSPFNRKMEVPSWLA